MHLEDFDCTQTEPHRRLRRCILDATFPRSLASTKPTGLLSIGRGAEALGTPKRRPPSMCRHWSLPTYLGLDVLRRSPTGYITNHPDTDRLGLVGIPSTVLREIPTRSLVI